MVENSWGYQCKNLDSLRVNRYKYAYVGDWYESDE